MRRRSAALAGVVLLAISAAACMPAEERTFLDRTNALRADRGIPTLMEHDTLTAKAEDWAQHMAATGQLSHSNITSGLGDLAWRALGENVGVSWPTGDTLQSLQDAFASSPVHRSNMLNGTYNKMGVGVATSADGRVWVVEVFAAA
jgi:uncharacterized protein YkwD